MSSGVIRALQPIVIGVETVLAVGLGVDDALAVVLGAAVGPESLGEGDGVGTQPLSAASASRPTARGTTRRRGPDMPLFCAHRLGQPLRHPGQVAAR